MIGRADHQIDLPGLIDVPLLCSGPKIALTAGRYQRVLVGLTNNAVWRFQTYRLGLASKAWCACGEGRRWRQHGDERRHGDGWRFLRDGMGGWGRPARAEYQRLFWQSRGQRGRRACGETEAGHQGKECAQTR